MRPKTLGEQGANCRFLFFVVGLYQSDYAGSSTGCRNRADPTGAEQVNERHPHSGQTHGSQNPLHLIFEAP
jgi:hypothetical protein